MLDVLNLILQTSNKFNYIRDKFYPKFRNNYLVDLLAFLKNFMLFILSHHINKFLSMYIYKNNVYH